MQQLRCAGGRGRGDHGGGQRGAGAQEGGALQAGHPAGHGSGQLRPGFLSSCSGAGELQTQSSSGALKPDDYRFLLIESD